MTKLCLVCDDYTEVTRERDYSDEWSGEDTYTSWSFDGIRVVGERDWGDIDSDFEVKPGDIVHCVIAIYSTGDSFSRHDCGSKEFVAVYKTHEKAKALEVLLENDEETISYELESGIVIPKYYKPWNGYFESLDRIIIETFVVGG